MKSCPTCKATYPDDANFCPQETCATPTGPQRLTSVAPVSDQKSRFQLGPRIGGGNTGDIYRATDTVTGAQVAYKIIASDVLPNAAALARAEREFKQLMRVQSSRIATIIDCGRTPDERLYVAMELVEGDSLDKSLRGDALPIERAKLIIAQIGQALLEAQKAGIVHRDVAPKNVLVTTSGDVKVVNFPLAKPINDRASGVAAYLSPEQVQGKPVDQRSNTYNLAALLYHLITGEPPFQGTPETVLELHVGSPPLAPSQRRPEAGLLPEVDRVILKALDKSSSRRHLTLRLFLSEVESLVAASSAPAATSGGKEGGSGGFARTMLFAGGQAEVANLVAKAIAARGGSPAGGVPITPAAPAPAAQPAAQPRRPSTPSGVPIGNAATIAAAPPTGTGPLRHISPTGVPVSPAPAPGNSTVVGVGTSDSPRPRLTPAGVSLSPAVNPAANPAANPSLTPASAGPVASAPMGAPISLATGTGSNPIPSMPTSQAPASRATAPVAAASKGSGKDAKGNAFRETLWFKKGDVEHMIAEARAKIASPEGKVAEAPNPAEEVLPIEDRYVDDGTVTADDRKKFSLRSGQTAAALPTVKAKVPGESMSEAEVLAEVSSGSRKVVVVLVALVLIVAAIAVVVTLMRSKPTPVPSLPPAAVLIPALPPAPSVGGAGQGSKPPLPAEIKKVNKIVAAPSKRDGGDKRATRRIKSRPRRR